jgi:hypothetical protein
VLLLLGVESGSNRLDAVTCAVLLIVPVRFTFPVIVSVADVSEAMLGIVQVGDDQEPLLGDTDTLLSPLGIESETLMFSAVSGPLLVSVITQVTESFISNGPEVERSFVNERSALVT